MKNLSINWFAEGLIDFEYKQYLLLAYLDEVKRLFSESRVYPSFSDLIFHYGNLKNFREAKKSFEQNFSRELTHFDFERLEAVYRAKEEKSDETIDEIDQIIEYAIPQFQFKLDEGKELFDYFNQHLFIEPIGLLPLFKNDGYVFVHLSSSRETHVYQYNISLFYDGPEKLRGVHTHYLTTYQLGIATTYENIKMELIKNNSYMPNPATYLIESEVFAPLEDTVLPIAKRKLLAVVVQDQS